jgi:hypothetical protein
LSIQRQKTENNSVRKVLTDLQIIYLIEVFENDKSIEILLRFNLKFDTKYVNRFLHKINNISKKVAIKIQEKL